MQGHEQLCYLYGIGYEYTRYNGERAVFSPEVRLAALAACGVDVDDEHQVLTLNHELDVAPWFSLLPPCSLVEEDKPRLKVRVPESECSARGRLRIKLDEAEAQCGIDLSAGEETGNFVYQGERYLELAVPIESLGVGYYKAELVLGERTAQTELWVVPEHCHQIQNKAMIGLSLQLYTLRNEHGFGVGDFADLLALSRSAGQLGLDYILLNPLHLLFDNQPERASPYSPNSRCLLNPLYISPVLCEDFHQSDTIAALMRQRDVSERLDALNNAEWLDYSAVTKLKYRIFELMFARFKANNDAQRVADFTAFCRRRRRVLAELSGSDAEYRHYLQWLAHGQLARCQKEALDAGMSIGLINDLAVGCSADGIDYHSNRALFAAGASVGAPPDPWSADGQDWGLPALNPLAIKQNRYTYFRDLLAENMREVGALRIDHVMALRRLWWCLATERGVAGCYVYYPFDYLLAAVKIESKRWHCALIGEDLGVVPPEVSAALKQAKIFSNILFYFEKNHEGEFRRPEELAEDALLMVANHDVPPFKGWWQGSDLEDKQAYSLWDNAQQFAEAQRERERERERLVHWLACGQESGISLDSEYGDVYRALMRVLAKAPARLLTLQLDDLDGQIRSVNIPGTDTEYPNWRRRLFRGTSEILSDNQPFINELLQLRQRGANR